MKALIIRYTLVILSVASVQLAVLPAAHAGQVGVTMEIAGPGRIDIVEGSVEAQWNFCVKYNNGDPSVVSECPRFVESAVFEAWLWLRAKPADGFHFAGWQGCDETRVKDGYVDCAVHSGAFNGVERRPRATFDDIEAPQLSEVSSTQVGTGDLMFDYTFTIQGNGKAYCRADMGPETPCNTNTGHRVQWTSEGPHTLHVLARDNAGNQSVVRTATVVAVDTHITSGPPSLTNSRSATFQLDSTAAHAYECALDGGAWVYCASGTAKQALLVNLPEGNHDLKIRGIADWSVDMVPATWRWSIDLTAPDTTMSVRSIDGRTASFTITTAAQDVSGFECRITTPAGTSSWRPCEPDLNLANLNPGPHSVESRAVDRAGNADPTPARHEWTVAAPDPGPDPDPDPDPGSDPGQDPTPNPGQNPGPTGGTGSDTTQDKTAPDTRLLRAPGDGSVLLATATTIEANSTEAGSFKCTLDDKPMPCADGRFTITSLRAGTHVIAVTATDSAGNADLTPAITRFTVPTDDRAATAARGWHRSKYRSAFGGTILKTTRAGASIQVPAKDVAAIAIVASSRAKGARMTVYRGRQKVASLLIPAGKRPRLSPPVRLSRSTSGRLRLVIQGKVASVQLDAIALLAK